MKTAAKKSTKGITAAQWKKVALSFPETAEGVSYTHPAVLAFGKFFTRYRKEDDSFVLTVQGIEHRDMLLEMDPKTYFITDHYKNFPGVLVRLERITSEEARTMLERRWRAMAPKKLLKELDTAASTVSAKPAKRVKKIS